MKFCEVDGVDLWVEYFCCGLVVSWLGFVYICEEMFGVCYLYVIGILLVFLVSVCELFYELMWCMCGRGVSLFFDFNLWFLLWFSECCMIVEINVFVVYVYWVLLGLEEGCLFSGWQEFVDIVVFYLDMGVDVVVIKFGLSGVYYCDVYGEGLVFGVLVVIVVDIVGVGDGFVVGVVSVLLEGLLLFDVVVCGNWIGSCVVQVCGDMEGLLKCS